MEEEEEEDVDMMDDSLLLLSKEQINTFLVDGYLVVDNVFNANEIEDAMKGLYYDTLLLSSSSSLVDDKNHHHDDDNNNKEFVSTSLVSLQERIRTLSSTDGSGGVLDVFYDAWKMRIATHPKLFAITKQIWRDVYNNNKESDDNNNNNIIIGNSSGSNTSNCEEDYGVLLDVETEDATAAAVKEGRRIMSSHPYGSFDCSRGYCYIDRICYRLPTTMSEKLGSRKLLLSHKMMNDDDDDDDDKAIPPQITEGEEEMTTNPTTTTTTTNDQRRKKKKNKKKKTSIQRCLTPHLDCCPDTFYTIEGKTKWRPMQCLVSLTDNREPNTGGFEAIKGFHRRFDEWIKQRPPTVVIRKNKNRHYNNNINNKSKKGKSAVPKKMKGSRQEDDEKLSTLASASSRTVAAESCGADDDNNHDRSIVEEELLLLPAPCIGEYTHIRPIEDEDVIRSVKHVPVNVGSVVFWDTRIVHASSYRNDTIIPRIVVYASFLPDIELNRKYAISQLNKWIEGRNPTDQWINNSKETKMNAISKNAQQNKVHHQDVNGQQDDNDDDMLRNRGSTSSETDEKKTNTSTATTTTTTTTTTTCTSSTSSLEYQLENSLLSPLARKLLMIDQW